MQDTINVTQEDTERGKSHDHRHCPTARPFKRFGWQMRTHVPALLICLFGLIGHGTSVAQMSHPPRSPRNPTRKKRSRK